MDTADPITEQNKADYGHDFEPQPNTNPLLVKYYYVESGGKKRCRTQAEEKILEGEAAVKSSKALGEAGIFSHALGDGASSSSVKAESSQYQRLQAAELNLRLRRLLVQLASYKGGFTHNS